MLHALYSKEVCMPSMDTIRKQKWRPTFLRSSLRENNTAGFEEEEEKKESSEDSTAASEKKDAVVVDPHDIVPSDVRQLPYIHPDACCESSIK
jgi:hypothetical protein